MGCEKGSLKFKCVMYHVHAISIFAYVSTMCEQGMMMIFAVHLLGLPWQLFPGILPLMVYERIVGTIGGTMIVVALMKAIPRYFARASDL